MTAGQVELWSLTERFNTEAEALHRVRQLQDHDPSLVIAIRDRQGHEMSGVTLQLRVRGYTAD